MSHVLETHYNIWLSFLLYLARVVFFRQVVLVLGTFGEVGAKYKNKYRERVERQYRIVKPHATKEEIDAAFDSGEPQPEIFTQLKKYFQSGGNPEQVRRREREMSGSEKDRERERYTLSWRTRYSRISRNINSVTSDWLKNL